MWAPSPAFRRAPSGLLFSLTSMLGTFPNECGQLCGRHATSTLMISLLSKVEREERAARLARQELEDTDLHQSYLFGKEWLLEFEPNKSQGLVVSNTKKRKNTEKLHPPTHGKNSSQGEEGDGNSWYDYRC